jgi:hypothetical protein
VKLHASALAAALRAGGRRGVVSKAAGGEVAFWQPKR